MRTQIRRTALAVTATGALLCLAAGQASASYKAEVRGATLEVIGDRASDRLVLRLDPNDPNTLQLDVGADATADFSFDRTRFTAVDVDAGSGDDEVSVSRIGGLFRDEALTFDGGSGDDVLLGGDGDDVIIGGSGDDRVEGNIGADVASLGAGTDTFTWDIGEGNDTVEGDGGSDVLNFNGSDAPETFAFTADGRRVRLTRTIFTLDLDSIETTRVRTRGESDTVNVGDLTGTDLELVDVDGSAVDGTPDLRVDDVVINGTAGADRVAASSPRPGTALVAGLATAVRFSGAEAGLDRITVNGLGGADSITSGAGVTGPEAVVFNGGDQLDTATFTGTGSGDRIGVASLGAPITAFVLDATRLDSIGVERLSVHGLDGGDQIRTLGDLSATRLTLDGGDGDDEIAGGNGADTLLGGSGDDAVDGNLGADDADLGSGDDVFRWDPGDGSDIVDGRSGADRMDFNGSDAAERIRVFRDRSRSLLTRDAGSITMDFDDVEDVAIRALGGIDNVAVADLTGTGIEHVDVDLAPSAGGGDAAADVVSVEGTTRRDVIEVTRAGTQVLVGGLAAQTRITGSEPTLDTLLIRALAGKDDVSVAPDVADLIRTVVGE
jgi:Ca2+-binding RTX toxin-like protein